MIRNTDTQTEQECQISRDMILIEETVLAIRERYYMKPRITYRSLGKLHGVSDVTICRIVKRKTWQHVKAGPNETTYVAPAVICSVCDKKFNCHNHLTRHEGTKNIHKIKHTIKIVQYPLATMKCRAQQLFESLDGPRFVIVKHPGSTVKECYKKAALTHHPDKGGDSAVFRLILEKVQQYRDKPRMFAQDKLVYEDTELRYQKLEKSNKFTLQVTELWIRLIHEKATLSIVRATKDPKPGMINLCRRQVRKAQESFDSHPWSCRVPPSFLSITGPHVQWVWQPKVTGRSLAIG